MECIQKIINFTALPDEIEQAKPNGNLDTVFNKYCNKRQDALSCVDNFMGSLDPCLSKEEKDQKVVFVNITKSLLEFVCHENGNQIAREFGFKTLSHQKCDSSSVFSFYRRGRP